MPDPVYSSRSRQGKTVTASDTTIITGPSGQVGTGRFLALTDGNIVGAFVESRTTRVTYPVLAGVEYSHCLAYFYTTSTATIMGLW